MAFNESRQTDPLQNLFADVKKIISFIEVKDQVQATAYETEKSRDLAEMWMNAQEEYDTYVTYHAWWDISMFQDVQSNVKLSDAKRWMDNPYSVPVKFRETLLTRGRQKFLDSYVETNDYYRMLCGLPPIDTNEKDFIYLSRQVRNQLHASDEPVHMLSTLIQNNYMATEEYQKVLKENPDKTYLKYLGMYKIDLYSARKAKDFEIIRYPSNRADINPNLLPKFATLYADYREYVMTTLYNKHLENVYTNYRNFMGLIIMTFVMLQIPNEGLSAINNRRYLDDAVLHVILSLYDIPSTLMLTTEVRRTLAASLLRLTMEKGTDDVYYDLVKILGYQDIIISKLMLMKGQEFDENGKALNSFNPYFVQLNLKDSNPYQTIADGQAPIHDYKKITDGDPMWWDLPDTRKVLTESSYTNSDSKYIVVEAVIQQMKFMFESIYFMRMILDNKGSTDGFMIQIPEIFGTETVSIYDLMVFILAATCMNNNLSGEIISEEGKLLATAGFNFDMDLDAFEEFLDNTKYVDKQRVRSFLENLTIQDQTDINRLFNDVMYPMREWLERKIVNATKRGEYIEYESIYRAMFTYDINRNSFLDDFVMPLEQICAKHGITESELRMFQHFYPRTMSGKAITVEDYVGSRYSSPFLSRDQRIDWYIHVVVDTPRGEDDRGYVYFHDILNSADLRELTNPDGTRVFMDYEDGDVGWEINKKAVGKAIELLEKLDEDALLKAYFQVDTPILNSGGRSYAENTKLPASIRRGLYKDILIEKLQMDMDGLAVPPATYQEYLYRKNPRLYELLTADNRFERDKDAWLDDVLKIVTAVESELGLHMKYFEQSVAGTDLFFKPLITLIKHFKSMMVDFAKTGLQYVFGDKMDAGGNSNMFKLFDEVKFVVHFVTLANTGYASPFQLYDTEHSMKHHIRIKDRSELLEMIVGSGFAARKREARMGSMHMVDEMKFHLNGTDYDPDGSPSHWICGEPGTGRWSEEDEILMRTRSSSAKIKKLPVDFEGWKDFVESANPGV